MKLVHETLKLINTFTLWSIQVFSNINHQLIK